MRWPRLTRRKAHDSEPSIPASAYKPGSWGQPTLPPVEIESGNVPTGNVEVIPTPAPKPVVAPEPPRPVIASPRVVGPPPRVAPSPATSAAPVEEHAEGSSGVRLGFEDGSDLHLDPDHPHSLALKAVADVLLHRGPHRRHAG